MTEALPSSSSNGSSAGTLPPAKPARLGRAIRRFGPYVWRYRGRALLVFVLGLGTGLLSKAPYVFIYSLINSVLEVRPAKAESTPSHGTALQRFDGILREV